MPSRVDKAGIKSMMLVLYQKFTPCKPPLAPELEEAAAAASLPLDRVMGLGWRVKCCRWRRAERGRREVDAVCKSLQLRSRDRREREREARVSVEVM